jgi:hypothetical protein
MKRLLNNSMILKHRLSWLIDLYQVLAHSAVIMMREVTNAINVENFSMPLTLSTRSQR